MTYRVFRGVDIDTHVPMIGVKALMKNGEWRCIGLFPRCMEYHVYALFGSTI